MPKLYQYFPKDGVVAIDPDKLRYWRDARFFTREEVAQDCKVSIHTVQSWELGRKNPTTENFRNICRALGVEPDMLMAEGHRYRAPKEES